MPRMIDLIRKSQLSSNMVQAAARGALAVPPGEMLEILVHLALHNKVFAEQARMTLAGWDEKACQQVAADSATSKEVLDYLISPRNLRPVLLPGLLENPAIAEEQVAELAAAGSRDVIEVMLGSARVKGSAALQEALRSNPRSRPNDLEGIGRSSDARETPARAQAVAATEVAYPLDTPALLPVKQAGASLTSAVTASEVVPTSAAQPEPQSDSEGVAEDALAQALEQFLEENKSELATAENKPFQPIGGIREGGVSEGSSPEHAAAPEVIAGESGGAPSATAKPGTPAAMQHAKKPVPHQEERRDSTLQKIAKLDIKGRIALAIRGGKEERSILIRDGTKLVALAVLDSPKVTDGEVEGFALQKNVLESVLRAIPLKRRFAKNYAIMRNLVYNPRTPLDLSLGLMKNLLIHDLKNLSGNKEISETIRKLALRMYKQKMEKKD